MVALFLGTAIALALASSATGSFTGLAMPAANSSEPKSGQCKLMKLLPRATQFNVALSPRHYGRGGHCGRCVQTQCDRCAASAPIIAQVTDRASDVGLSKPMLRALFGSGAPSAVTWDFVDCPVNDPIALCTKPRNTSAYIIYVQPTNTVAGVQNMTIDGFRGRLTNASYHFKAPMPANWSNVRVSMKSFTGDAIAASVALRPGRCVTIPHQFSPSPAAASGTPAVIDYDGDEDADSITVPPPYK
uniref:Secreted protein n=1 Tax=Achlya hypogyna TaxID=1202772 RepID=A0A0A7CN09_ACHHY|nr:secreted protein [Achlya hypogyna]